MSKLAYVDCPTGIAGDMCLGALVDLGVPLDCLQVQLETLPIAAEFTLTAQSVLRQGMRATLVEVTLHPEYYDHSHAHRHLDEIVAMITTASFPPRVQDWSVRIFQALAIAEGKVHGIPPEKVHFHEVGATDAIVDIVGTCLGLDWLGVEQLYCSAMPTGGGTVKAAHGVMPVPVPAVLQLWQQRQVPVYANGIERELVTPTGAAIAVTLAQSFGPAPAMTVHRIGLGAGQADFPIANILRIWLGEESASAAPVPLGTANDLETVMVLETQVDDLNPQAIGIVFEQLMAAGAVDVFTQAVGMKKSRPGLLITVICPPEMIGACEEVLFQETTTLGIRRTVQQRRILERHCQSVKTIYGSVQVKLGMKGDRLYNLQPEYEDCRRLAQEYGVAWWQVQQQAIYTWYRDHPTHL